MNWEYFNQPKLKHIKYNNPREDKALVPYVYTTGNQVMTCLAPQNKHRTELYSEPYTIAKLIAMVLSCLFNLAAKEDKNLEIWNICLVDAGMA